MARESSKPIVRQHRVDLAIRVELKYPDRDVFVERFAQNVSRTGLFVRAKDPPAVGSRVRFEYKLADGTRLLRGVGIVRWARTAATAKEPDQPAGMGIEFVDLDADSEELIGRIVALHGEGERAPRRAAARPAAAGGVTGAGAGRPRPAARPLDREEETALDSLLEGLGLGEALPARTPERGPQEGERDDAAADLGRSPLPGPAAASNVPDGSVGTVDPASLALDTTAAVPAEGASPEHEAGAATLADGSPPEPEAAPDGSTETASIELDAASDASPDPARSELVAATAAPEVASPGLDGGPDVSSEAASLEGAPAASRDPASLELDVDAAPAVSPEPPTPAMDVDPAPAVAPEPATPDGDGDAAPAASPDVASLDAEIDAAPAATPDAARPAFDSSPGVAPDAASLAPDLDLRPGASGIAGDTRHPGPVASAATPPSQPEQSRADAPAALAEAPQPDVSPLERTGALEHAVDAEAEGPGAPEVPTPPAPPRLLSPAGEELREPEDPVTPTLAGGGAPIADAELVVDLSSSAWRAAVVPRGGAFANVGDAVDPTAGAGEAAQALPSPFDWLVVPWPAPRARVLARRLGLELVDDESGFPAVRWQGLDVSSAALLQLGLEQLLGAVSPSAPPRHARIVLPASASDAARRLLLRRLSGLGVARCVVTPAPAAVLARVPGDHATPALVIEVLRLEARLALVGDGGELLAARGCLEAGYDAADGAVAAVLERVAGVRLAGSDGELLGAVRTARRAAPAGPWLLAAGGEEHAIETETVSTVARAGYEALALTADELLRGNDLDPDCVRIVVAPEEPLWPGLAGTLAEVLGARAIQLEPDPWIRLRGLTPA